MTTLKKRDSLEQFIREQILGPGINGYRYIDLENQILTNKNIYLEKSIDYTNEILDIVPAAVYSTGILFPNDDSGTLKDGILLDNNEQIDKKHESDEEDSQNSSSDDIEATDTLDLNQMFPRIMGITYCLDETFLYEGVLKFKVSLRYYKKIRQDKEGLFNNRYGLLCEVNVVELQKFLVIHKLNEYKIKTINANSFILLSKLNNDEKKNLRIKVREIINSTAKNVYDKIFVVFSIPNLRKEHCNLSNLKSSLYYELKNTITDIDLRKKIYEITQEIELIENITDHLKNLLDVGSDSYGLWQSEFIQRTIQIEEVEFNKPEKKKYFLHNKRKEGEKITVFHENGSISLGLQNLFCFYLDDKKEDYASLSANVQLSRDSRKETEKIFVKIQLINTSTAFDEAKQNGNRYYSTFNELVNQKCFFGVKLQLEDKYIVPYSDHTYISKNGVFSEDSTTQFIYDQFNDFAIGHGCSVKWNKSDAQIKIETEYLPFCETPDIDSIPRDKSKTPIQTADSEFVSPLFLENSKSQEFKWLSIFSDVSNSSVIIGLEEFVDSYGNWIKLKRANNKYQNTYSNIATQELNKCESDYLRMKTNISDFLSGQKNLDNLNSFRLMNGTMFMQLWHSIKVKDGKVIPLMEKADFFDFDFDFYTMADDKLFAPYNEPAGWRAFQLAFILLNLDGIFKIENDSLWEHRNNWVDLVWFPTGGGKTEAYLGLIALTIINRRKIHKDYGGGTASIMRYTLRLLTMQQFQRATLVIMALESIRKWRNYELGTEPITIGLWVGDNSLPNRIDDLIKEYQNLRDEKSNKIPFSNCPWCGSSLRPVPSDAKVNDSNDTYNFNKVHLYCNNNKCSYSEPDFFEGNIAKSAIPINLCDETIYQHPPTLLFGTVDKFAQLAHKVNGTNSGRIADSRRLFGKGNWEKGKPQNGYLPPDLIIQDELHLLLGPLGSAVALYESAIDQLCTRPDGTRPKIISSTATTRNTQLQIAALFDRKVNLFPKPGVECDDSFFAFYRRVYKNQENRDEVYLSKRKYIGVLPTGRTQIWMQMRLAAIIMTHRAIFELKELEGNSPIDFEQYKNFEKAMDFYHTTISYFNSLKEVGKTQSQIQTYILKELRRVFFRIIRPQKLMHAIYTYGPIQESELTGRLSGEEVKNELKNVETKWNATKRFANFNGKDLVRGKIPPEFVVATNMISVGIDVSRFNTIIVNSMPRNTAEYIQASSRVARNDYGLVLTVHHPFRARDISHYEKFIEFHEKMYSYVEPISITPFTQKAVERYMGLYLATMIRHTTRFTERNSAIEISTISETDLLNIILKLTKYFQDRKIRLSFYDNLISNLLTNDNLIQIKKWIEDAFFDWKQESDKAIAQNKDLVFNNKYITQQSSQEQLYVDIEEYEGNIHSKKWQVPMSLRVIEPEAAIKINSL